MGIATSGQTPIEPTDAIVKRVIETVEKIVGMPFVRMGDVIEQLDRAVNGDVRTDTDGLRQRVKTLEELANEMRKLQVLIKGVGIGLTFTGLATLANFVITLIQILRSSQ